MQEAPRHPEGPEDPLNARVVVVTDAVNAYLAAILSGDPQAIEAASLRWEAIADKEEK